ncbi:MAG: DedA family protein [Bacillota bacterium]|nr:DedA family protein [Bacillota bacterium]
MLESIANFIIDVINSLGYFGIAAGMILESACIPIPSELILPIAGTMAANGVVGIIGANLVAAIASVLGSLLAYTVGYYGGRPFILKYGKYFFVKEEHFYKAERTFIKYGSVAVFFGRLIPLIRTFISLPAGIAKMDLKKFITYSLIGMLPWNFLLIFLGYKFGNQFGKKVMPIFHQYEYIILGLIVVAVLLLILRSVLKKRKARA